MQEDLEPFGVKIKSSFRTEAEAQVRRTSDAFRAHHESGAEVQVKRGAWEADLPQPVEMTDDKVLAVGADHGVVGNRGGTIQLEGKPTGATYLKADPRGAGLSLGEDGGGAEQSDDDQEGGKKR